MNSLLGRILVAAAILMSVLLMLFALTRWLGAEQKPEEVQLYQGIPLDATLIQLDRRALNEAYHAQLIKLFGVWLTEGAREPRFITNGLQIARRAYHTAAQQIATREQQILKQEQKQQQKP